MKTRFEPVMLKWARERAGLDPAQLSTRILGPEGKLDRVLEWEETGEMTFRQGEELAAATHIPFGYLFLKNPPSDSLPIRDFRTVEGAGVVKPSANLLDTIYQCELRQNWYRDYLVSVGREPVDYVGALNTEFPLKAATEIRDRFGIGPGISSESTSTEQNLTLHIEALEDAGVLVMRSGVVGNNNTRKLSVDEFRGFSLSDEYAPLIFINSADAQPAQLFTLVHELVHICAGNSGVSNPIRSYSSGNPVEQYCNEVAAEVLVPINFVIDRWKTRGDPVTEIGNLARVFKVSKVVAARRAKDAGFITEADFKAFYDAEMERFRSIKKVKGGSFYNSLNARASSQFCRALVSSTLEGRTTYRDAFSLLNVSNTTAFHNFAREKLGFDVG